MAARRQPHSTRKEHFWSPSSAPRRQATDTMTHAWSSRRVWSRSGRYVAAAALLVFCVGPVRAASNVTVWPSDTIMEYHPREQWTAAQPEGLSAMFTTSRGAKATLKFKGVAVYLQVTRGAGYALATINLDGTNFAFNTTSASGDMAESVWGVVALPDEEHVLTVAQTDANGAKLSITALVYTSSRDSVPVEATAAPQADLHRTRNVVLTSILSILGVVVFTTLGYLAWRRKQKRSAAELERAIQLEVTPTSPRSLRTIKSFGGLDEKGMEWQAHSRAWSMASTTREKKADSTWEPAVDFMQQCERDEGGLQLYEVHQQAHQDSASHPSMRSSLAPSAITASTLQAPAALPQAVDMTDAEAVRNARRLTPLITAQRQSGSASSLRSAPGDEADHLMPRASTAAASVTTAASKPESSFWNKSSMLQVPSMAKPSSIDDDASTAGRTSTGLAPWPFSVSSSILPAGFNVLGSRSGNASARSSATSTNTPGPVHHPSFFGKKR